MSNQEFIDANKDLPVYFSSYYKYGFTYTGETKDGDPFIVLLGGDPDDIYRVELTSEETIGSLVSAVGEIEIVFQ